MNSIDSRNHWGHSALSLFFREEECHPGVVPLFCLDQASKLANNLNRFEIGFD